MNTRIVVNSEEDDVVLSPCVGICALGDNDVCMGCYRSGQEISQWGLLDNDGKKQVLENVEQRLKES